MNKKTLKKIADDNIVWIMNKIDLQKNRNLNSENNLRKKGLVKYLGDSYNIIRKNEQSTDVIIENDMFYVLGKNESCKTPADRFYKLSENKSEVDINVDDDLSLKESTKRKEELNKEEGARLSKILSGVSKNLISNKNIKSQNIFGTRGYSISHYAKVVRADILVINSVEKRFYFLSRLFQKDLDYILSELPTDVLIIKPNTNV